MLTVATCSDSPRKDYQPVSETPTSPSGQIRSPPDIAGTWDGVQGSRRDVRITGTGCVADSFRENEKQLQLLGLNATAEVPGVDIVQTGPSFVMRSHARPYCTMSGTVSGNTLSGISDPCEYPSDLAFLGCLCSDARTWTWQPEPGGTVWGTVEGNSMSVTGKGGGVYASSAGDRQLVTIGAIRDAYKAARSLRTEGVKESAQRAGMAKEKRSKPELDSSVRMLAGQGSLVR